MPETMVKQKLVLHFPANLVEQPFIYYPIKTMT